MNEEDKTSFIQTIGDSPLTRVLDFLICCREFDYSLSDIAKNAEVGWTTLHIFWPELEKRGIVKQTRMVGKAKMYKLNTENPVVKALIKFDFEISKYYGELELERQGHKLGAGGEVLGKKSKIRQMA